MAPISEASLEWKHILVYSFVSSNTFLSKFLNILTEICETGMKDTKRGKMAFWHRKVRKADKKWESQNVKGMRKMEYKQFLLPNVSTIWTIWTWYALMLGPIFAKDPVGPEIQLTSKVPKNYFTKVEFTFLKCLVETFENLTIVWFKPCCWSSQSTDLALDQFHQPFRAMCKGARM